MTVSVPGSAAVAYAWLIVADEPVQRTVAGVCVAMLPSGSLNAGGPSDV